MPRGLPCAVLTGRAAPAGPPQPSRQHGRGARNLLSVVVHVPFCQHAAGQDGTAGVGLPARGGPGRPAPCRVRRFADERTRPSTCGQLLQHESNAAGKLQVPVCPRGPR